jgi:hypothetical protein
MHRFFLVLLFDDRAKSVHIHLLIAEKCLVFCYMEVIQLQIDQIVVIIKSQD